MRRVIVMVCCLFLVFVGLIFSGEIVTSATTKDTVDITEEEREYISARGPIRIVVDPDWYPYEQIDDTGIHKGIAANLIALVAQRTGLVFELIPTSNWEESLEMAKSGEADVVSLLNQTEERSKWLIFTEPYFIDPNVFITREEHDYISNLSRLTNETMVLPEGTSVEERLRKDYPDLKIIIVKSEQEAISYVDNRKADMSLRSLTMAAYVIKNGGYFNLKVAGEISNYTNQLRMGITKQDTMLQGILNKAIKSISEQEIQNAINQHISIKIMKGFDYRLFGILLVIFTIILVSGLYWISRIHLLNKRLNERQEELLILTENLAEGKAKYRKISEELEYKNKLLEEVATTDYLTGLHNRNSFSHRFIEEMERAKRYNTPLSLLELDLDHFKRINDTYGHDVGDKVIIKLTETLQSNIRKVDMLFRWGGEEFVILLPGIGLNEAIIVAEKLRQVAKSLIHQNNETVTVSIGASTCLASDTMETMFKRTDRALYHAKQQGRNRVCVTEHSDDLHEELLTWDQAWESGHLGIDKQHKELIEICNKLILEIMQNDFRLSIKPELEKIMRDIRNHFAYEEEVLIQLNYKDVSRHRQLHQKLLEDAKKLVDKADEGILLPADVVLFIVGDMVKNHLIQEDLKFFSLFKE